VAGREYEDDDEEEGDEGDDDVWLRRLHGVLHHEDERLTALLCWSKCGNAFGIHQDAIKLLGKRCLFNSCSRLLTFRRQLVDFGLDVVKLPSSIIPSFPSHQLLLEEEEEEEGRPGDDLPADITCYVGGPWLSKALSADEFCAAGLQFKTSRFAS
jgi:hypothetical protein